MNYDYKQLDAWRLAVVRLAGWEVGDRHRMRHGRQNSWTTTMCRHPDHVRGRWRTIGHLPNPGYHLHDCVQLEQQLLTEEAQRMRFGRHLIEIVLEGKTSISEGLNFLNMVAVAQASPGQRLHALVWALRLKVTEPLGGGEHAEIMKEVGGGW